jgi:hypothetical protein
MSKEIMNVEFEVESTINKECGFQEKIIRFRGGDTRYKGIVKEGVLVAILGKNYKLITNESVEKAVQNISAINDYYCGGKYEGWKIFDWVWSKNGKHGVMVANSVDGTIALKCIAIQKLKGNHVGVLVTNKIRNVQRRHTKKAVSSVEDLESEVGAVMDESLKYGEWLSKMGALKARDAMDTLRVLCDKLPKDYTKGLSLMTTFRTFGEPTVKDVYEMIAQKIWSADTKMVTKLTYYRVLNDLMFIIVGI